MTSSVMHRHSNHMQDVLLFHVPKETRTGDAYCPALEVRFITFCQLSLQQLKQEDPQHLLESSSLGILGRCFTIT